MEKHYFVIQPFDLKDHFKVFYYEIISRSFQGDNCFGVIVIQVVSIMVNYVVFEG